MNVPALLTAQFNGAWALYYQLLANTDDDAWRSEGTWYLAPARLAVHIPSSIEYYIDHQSEMRERFEERWSDAPLETVPSIGQTRRYAAAVRSAVKSWIADVDLASTDVSRFPWVGDTLADAALFALRHAHYHLGEWHAVLAQRMGSDAGDPWVPEG